jgi:hypothetical protein
MMQSTFGHGDVLIWMVEIFLFVVWFWLLMNVMGDLFRDHDMSGGVKAVWIIALIVSPFIGVFVYLVVRGSGMAARSARALQEAQSRFDSYVRSVASEGPADQIQKAKALLDAGTIDQTEFEALKAKALRA